MAMKTDSGTEISDARPREKKPSVPLVSRATNPNKRNTEKSKAILPEKEKRMRQLLHEQRKRLHAISERTRTREVAAKIRELRQMMLEQGVRCPENKATTLITAVEYSKILAGMESKKRHRNNLLQMEYQRLQAQLQQLPKPFGAGVTSTCCCGRTQVFDKQPLPVVLVNSRLRIQDCSTAFLSMLGIASKGWASNQLLTTLCLKEGPKSRPGTPHPLELCWSMLNVKQGAYYGQTPQSCFTILLREKNEHEVMLNMVGSDLMQLTFLKYPEQSFQFDRPFQNEVSAAIDRSLP